MYSSINGNDSLSNSNINIDDNIYLTYKSNIKEDNLSNGTTTYLRKRSRTSNETEPLINNEEINENLNNLIDKEKKDVNNKENNMKICVEIIFNIIPNKRIICKSEKIIQTDKSIIDDDESDDD